MELEMEWWKENHFASGLFGHTGNFPISDYFNIDLHLQLPFLVSVYGYKQIYANFYVALQWDNSILL